MAITYSKDGAYIEVTEDGVVYRRSIKWEDCMVSFPTATKLKIDRTYINDSDQLVLVLTDDSEITVTGVTDHGDLTGVTANQHHIKFTLTEHTAIGNGAPHHARYLDSEAVTAAKTVKLDDFATPDDNTDLNASTSRHGLLLKLGGGTTNFLRADGAWGAPAGGVSSEEALAYALSS